MQKITFRPCRPEDVDAAIPLIYSSGPAAFDYVFCDNSAQQSREFLHNAFVQGDSEFGYRQHIAAVRDGTVVGIGAVRDASQNFSFTLAALKRIASFYPPLAAARTLTRGLRAETIIKPPGTGVGILYHLGVAPEARGRGIGRQLVEELLQRIRERELHTAALDVARSNPHARSLYQQLGFTDRCTRHGGLDSEFGGVTDHIHMELRLTARPEAVDC